MQPWFARWAISATDAGWKIGWRDAIDSSRHVPRAIEVYCYASLPVNFFENESHQLYWITDVVQMTRSLMEGSFLASIASLRKHKFAPQGNRRPTDGVDSVPVFFLVYGWQVRLRTRGSPVRTWRSRTSRGRRRLTDRLDLPKSHLPCNQARNATLASLSHCARKGVHRHAHQAGDYHDRFSLPPRHAPQPRRS